MERPLFDTLSGHTVHALYPIFHKFGVFNGVQFLINGQELSFVVEADECDLSWGKDNPVLVQKGHMVIR